MAVITTKVGTGGKATFTVTIQPGDPTDWGIYISSKTDFGRGMSARGADYPYYVTEIHGTGSKSVEQILTSAQYVGELALRGIGVVDYTTFEIKPSPSNPVIYNSCWQTAGGECAFPAVVAGQTVDIRADIANTGPAGEVMCGFKINGTNKYAENNLNLPTFSDTNPAIWTVYYRNFVMPSSDVKLDIVTLYLDGSGSWVQTDTKTFTISTKIPGCTSLTLSPYTTTVNQIGDKVNLTVSATPTNIAYTVTFKDKDTGTVYGTCKTVPGSGGSGTNSCAFAWDSAGKTVGQNYTVLAYADSCISTASVIQIMPPITQANLNIRVLDNDSGNPVLGATVQANKVGSASQTKVTDSTGTITFRLDLGTVNVTVSKNGYNTKNDVESLYSDVSVVYYLVPIPVVPTTGSLLFVSVPVGAEIYLDGKDTGQKTTATITGLTAGNHNYTLKLAGFNDLSGTVTVKSGDIVTVPLTLSKISPSMGSVLINSNPMGAEIFVDGIDTGMTTSGMAVIKDIPPGSHSYKLTMSGYQDKTGTFDITAGNTNSLLVDLVPLVNIGQLDIDSEPSGARIYVNDVDTKYTTPASILNLKEGDYKYKVVLSGYKDVSGGFTIKPGEITKVHIVFEKTTGIGSGIALAVGVGAGLVAIAGFVGKKEKV